MKKEILRKKRKKEKVTAKELFVSHSTFHILNAIKVVAKIKKKKLENEAELRETIDEAIRYVEDVVSSTQKEREELYSHDKFFKEPQTCKEITAYINKTIQA